MARSQPALTLVATAAFAQDDVSPSLSTMEAIAPAIAAADPQLTVAPHSRFVVASCDGAEGHDDHAQGGIRA